MEAQLSRFYASIQGERGEATRQGHKEIVGHVRGWGSGIEVRGMKGAVDPDRDVFYVYATSGSGFSRRPILLGALIDGEWKQEPQDDE